MGSLPHKDYLWHAEQRQTLHVCATKMGVSSTYVCVCEMGRRKKKGRVSEEKKLPPSGVSSACRDEAWNFLFDSNELKRRRTRCENDDLSLYMIARNVCDCCVICMKRRCWNQMSGVTCMRLCISHSHICVWRCTDVLLLFYVM